LPACAVELASSATSNGRAVGFRDEKNTKVLQAYHVPLQAQPQNVKQTAHFRFFIAWHGGCSVNRRGASVQMLPPMEVQQALHGYLTTKAGQEAAGIPLDCLTGGHHAN
jgi:hypothetical protein